MNRQALDELVERLREGVTRIGDTETDDGPIELYDIESSNEMMEEAADALTAQAAMLEEALAFVNEASGAALGIAMSGTDHPNADEVLLSLSRRGMDLATKLSACRALASNKAGGDRG